MDAERRAFLGALAVALGASGLGRAAALGLQNPPGGQRPRRRPFPDSRDEEPESKEAAPAPREVLKAYEKDLKKDVERLFQLAQELKQEVEKTDSKEVLSLQILRKAEEIEKLARNIKNLARG